MTQGLLVGKLLVGGLGVACPMKGSETAARPQEGMAVVGPFMTKNTTTTTTTISTTTTTTTTTNSEHNNDNSNNNTSNNCH